MHYHSLVSVMRKDWFAIFTVKGSLQADMTVSTVSTELLIVLQPHWLVHRHKLSVLCKDWTAAVKVKVTVKV